jgi:hypothetical protein
VGIHRRLPNHGLLEVRQRTAQIRSAARKGKTAAEIAETCGAPLKMVEQVLAPVVDARLSDPALLLNGVPAVPGLVAADIQVYWVGFLTSAGRICGQGPTSALVVTLGDRSQEYMHVFLADLATPQVRSELCRSSLVGWQLYVRDRNLCEALLRWGIPSDVYGDDPGVLDDLPAEVIAPFLRGYLDGSLPSPGGSRSRSGGLVLHGTEAVLAGINSMISRGWSVGPGVVTRRSARAELRFSRRDEAVILERIQTYRARSRHGGNLRPA